MKPAIKTLWLIIAAALLIGAGLAGLGFALGGTKPAIYFDREGAHVTEASQLPVTKERNLTQTPFNNIKVQVVDADVKIVTSETEEYGCTLRYSSQGTISERVENGTLTITQDNDSWFMFRLFAVQEQGGLVTIKIPAGGNLPANTEFGQISVRTVSGDITLPALRPAGVELATVSGDIHTYGTISTKTLTAHTVSGTAQFARIGVTKAVMQTVSGDLICSNLHAANLKLGTTSGDMRVVGDVTGRTDVETVSGEFNFDFARPRDAYRITMAKVSAELHINGKQVAATSEFEEAPNATSTISLHSTSGDANLTFNAYPTALE